MMVVIVVMGVTMAVMSDTRVLGIATLPTSEATHVVSRHPELAQQDAQAGPFIIAVAAHDAAEAGVLADLVRAFRTGVAEQSMSAAEVLRALLPVGRLTSMTPAMLQQLHRNAEARAELSDEFGLLSSSEVALLAGSRATNAPALASRWKSQGQLFTVEADRSALFPGFQFDDSGRPLRVIADILAVFKGKLSGWELALWFTSPNTWLGDVRPVDALVSEPALVTEAAEHLAEELLG